MFVYVLFYLGRLSHYPSCFGADVTDLWVFCSLPITSS